MKATNLLWRDSTMGSNPIRFPAEASPNWDKGRSAPKPAPALALPNLEGKTVSLADLKGKVVLVPG